jgi:imidazolonepropionase-like amidohydrolase
MRFVPPALRAAWKNNRQLAFLTAYQFERLRLYDEKRREFVRALHQGEAKVLLGTDTPGPYIVPGFSVHEELRNLVDVGFTPYEAIDAATNGPARFLKSQDQWGTIAVGRRADLILLRANPLADVGNVSRRAGVMVRGRWLREEELQGSLERLASSYAHTPLKPTRFLPIVHVLGY